MSFTPKYLTQGGQMTAYRLRMFAQVNQWIFNWLFLLFLISTGGVFWAVLDRQAVIQLCAVDEPEKPGDLGYQLALQ
jgi:hypothetical protein